MPAAPGWKLQDCVLADGYFGGGIIGAAAWVTAFKICCGGTETILPVREGKVKWRTLYAVREETDKTPVAVRVTAQTVGGEQEVYSRKFFTVPSLPFEPDRFYYPASDCAAILKHGFKLPAKVEFLDGKHRKLREFQLTENQGKYSLAGLKPGSYHFRITESDGRYWMRTVVLTTEYPQPVKYPPDPCWAFPETGSFTAESRFFS